MMSAKMGTVNDEDMIRMAFRVLDKDGSGTISSKTFKHLMTHIGKYNNTVCGCWLSSLVNFDLVRVISCPKESVLEKRICTFNAKYLLKENEETEKVTM